MESTSNTIRRVKVVHTQYNSPLRLYSPEAVANTLNRHSRLLANGAMGIDFTLLATPNLANSEVLKMLAEEEQTHLPWQLHNMTSSPEVKRVAWPPPNPKSAIETKVETEMENTKLIPDGTIFASSEESNQENDIHHVSSSNEGIIDTVPVDNTPSESQLPAISDEKVEENDFKMSDAQDAFASNELVGERKIIEKPALPDGFVLNTFALKREAPITQKPNPIVPSEPVFKQATTLRKLGDMVWPPKSASAVTQAVNQEPIPTKRQQKNYQQFFGQHQLNASFPMYRAPPGTQHFGLVEGENATPM